MLTQKLLSKNLKKSLATALPVIALGGFLSTATMIQVASAGSAEKKQELATEVNAELAGKSITAEQRENLKAQLLAEGKTEEEAEAEIEALLKQAAVKK